MPLRAVVYKKKDTQKWVAEINQFETLPDSHLETRKRQIWQGVFSTKKDADQAAEREMEKSTESVV